MGIISQVTHTIWYEQPLNERMRTLLRLEHLFTALDNYFVGEDAWQVRACLNRIIDIFNLLQRSDFKTEVIKELERSIGVLVALQNTPGVDENQLTSTLNNCHECIGLLHQATGMIGNDLKENELFMAAVQRSGVEGGTSPFDLPMMHYWLNLDIDQQKAQLNEWRQPFKALIRSTKLVLSLVRDSAYPESLLADNGGFQRALPKDNHFQLMRVGVDTSLGLISEISGNKQHVSVRFLAFESTQTRPKQTSTSVPFELMCCGL